MIGSYSEWDSSTKSNEILKLHGKGVAKEEEQRQRSLVYENRGNV